MTTMSMPKSAPRPHYATTSRRLLLAGAIAGPLFTIASWTQVASRDDFDITRHALSQLALGPGGWMQTATFTASGGLYLAGAIGLVRARSQGRLPQWTAALLAVFAVTMLLAAAFPTDPANGYPVGSTAPATPSLHAVIHEIAPSTGIILAAITILLFGVDHWRARRPAWALTSLVAAAQMFIPDLYPGLGNPGYTLALAVTGSAGFVFLSVLLGDSATRTLGRPDTQAHARHDGNRR